MQLSELYRRSAVVPLDASALNQLRDEAVDESTAVRIAALQSQEDFDWLCDVKFLEKINQATGTLLDDYETDEVPASYAGAIQEIAQELLAHDVAPQGVLRFLRSLIGICQNAKDNQLPIVFVL
ncbi:MAG: hypothetical protein AAFV36_08740 [Myxococcota bacterium]